MPLAVVVGISVRVLIGVELGEPNEGGGTEAREESAPRSVSDTRW